MFLHFKFGQRLFWNSARRKNPVNKNTFVRVRPMVIEGRCFWVETSVKSYLFPLNYINSFICSSCEQSVVSQLYYSFNIRHCAVMTALTSPALLCSSRTVTVTAWVCLLLVLEIQTAPPCWMRRTVGSQRAVWSLHKGTVPRGPAEAPDAADWTARLPPPAWGDRHPCSLVRASLAPVLILLYQTKDSWRKHYSSTFSC